MPVIPSPTSAGVFGMALTTRTLPPNFPLILSIVIPGAIEIMTFSDVITFSMFFKTASYICGLTAKIIYFALFAHSALLSAYFTPVCALIFSHFSLCGVVNIICPGANSPSTPFNIAYPIFPIPINPNCAIFLPPSPHIFVL